MKTTATKIQTVDNDPAVLAARRRRDDVRQKLDDANRRGAMPAGMPVPRETKARRDARDEAEELLAELMQAEADVRGAEDQARARLDAQRQPEQQRLNDAVHHAADDLAEKIKAATAYAAETVNAGGSRSTVPHEGFLAQHQFAREQERVKSYEPRPENVSKDRRLRATIDMTVGLIRVHRGDVFTIDAKGAADALKRGLAEEVLA